MWIIIFIVIAIVVFDIYDRKEKAESQKWKEEKKKQKEEGERQQKFNSILAIRREIKNVPRILQLSERVIECANEHRPKLDHIWIAGNPYATIYVSLRDTQKDKWAPVIRGQSLEICSFDVQFRTDDETAAFMYLILCNCPYLTYKIGTEESRDLKAACYSIDSDGDFRSYATCLYAKKYNPFDFLRQKG